MIKFNMFVVFISLTVCSGCKMNKDSCVEDGSNYTYVDTAGGSYNFYLNKNKQKIIISGPNVGVSDADEVDVDFTDSDKFFVISHSIALDKNPHKNKKWVFENLSCSIIKTFKNRDFTASCNDLKTEHTTTFTYSNKKGITYMKSSCKDCESFYELTLHSRYGLGWACVRGIN